MQTALTKFALIGTPVVCQRYGNGHINETYLVATAAGRLYILQKINRTVFTDPYGLMRNVVAVTEHLARKDTDPRHVMQIVPATDGAYWWESEAHDVWRMLHFVTDSVCLDRAQDADEFMQSGIAFGHFQRQLADFQADTLVETIPRFHDTANRYAQLHAAIAADAAGRAAAVMPEIEFALAREQEAGIMVEMGRTGALPLRVTHNDTKLNNVMLDYHTHKPLCVIDLDTVMPGLAGNDFGDSIRFGASTAAEDERDLSRVELSLPYYEAYTRGFLGACEGSLTAAEVSTLPLAAKLMTLECGIRFLADYLAEDVYFHIDRPDHNLDRTRTQLKLVADMETKWDAMNEIVLRYA